jgi:hypothetical protein
MPTAAPGSSPRTSRQRSCSNRHARRPCRLGAWRPDGSQRPHRRHRARRLRRTPHHRQVAAPRRAERRTEPRPRAPDAAQRATSQPPAASPSAHRDHKRASHPVVAKRTPPRSPPGSEARRCPPSPQHAARTGTLQARDHACRVGLSIQAIDAASVCRTKRAVSCSLTPYGSGSCTRSCRRSDCWMPRSNAPRPCRLTRSPRMRSPSKAPLVAPALANIEQHADRLDDDSPRRSPIPAHLLVQRAMFEPLTGQSLDP